MKCLFLTLCFFSTISTTILALPRLSNEEAVLSGNDVECGEHDILLPHSDCRKYYVCFNGDPIVLRCSTPLFFNKETKECDYQINVPECVGGTRPPTGTSPNTEAPATEGPTTEAPQTEAPPTESPPQPTTDAPVDTTAADKSPCPAGVPLVYIAHPEDCNAFYLCRNGVVSGGEYFCGRDLWFSSLLQGCVDPMDSDCPAA